MKWYDVQTDTIEVDIPTYGLVSVTVKYCLRGKHPEEFAHIQKARTGERSPLGKDPEQTAEAKAFLGRIPYIAGALGSDLAAFECDAIVAIKSRFAHSEWLRAQANKRRPMRQPVDLTDRFKRLGNSLSGLGQTTIPQLAAEMEYNPDGGEGEIDSILIVDDSLGSGNSVGAVITKLFSAGIPRDCRFTLAVYFWAES